MKVKQDYKKHLLAVIYRIISPSQSGEKSIKLEQDYKTDYKTLTIKVL